MGPRVHDLEDAGNILDTFQRHGHNEIDTARIYGGGSSEEMLASLSWKQRGLVMDTKLYPNSKSSALGEGYTHSAQDVRRGLANSLQALETENVDIFYLHAPDRNIPFEVTLREVINLYQEGRFARFGLSNYMSWEVAQICEICKANNWIMPPSIREFITFFSAV